MNKFSQIICLTVLVFFFGSTKFIVKAEEPFSDVVPGHDFQTGVSYLYDNGVINGYSDGTFKPYNRITRAEFTKILVKASLPEVDVANCNTSQYTFPDIIADNKFIKEICVAKQYGLVNGYSDGMFYPDRNISLGESANIIVHGLLDDQTITTDAWFGENLATLIVLKAIPVETTVITSRPIQRWHMTEMVYRIQAEIYDKESLMLLHQDFLPDNPEDPYYEGLNLWTAGAQFTEVKVYYEIALMVDQNYAPALSSYGSGISNHEIDVDNYGIELIERAKQIDPNWAYSYLNLGLIYNVKCERDKMRENLNYLVDNFTDHPDYDYFRTVRDDLVNNTPPWC